MIESEQMPDRDLSKARYFDAVAKTLIPEMRTLFKGGKLWSAGNWRNVAEHCLVESVAVGILAQSMGLSDEKTVKLASIAAVHDWDKLLRIRPTDFSEAERAKAQELIARVAPNEQILAATEPSFNERFANHAADISLEEKILFYVDNICAGSEIVNLDARLDEVEARRPDLGAVYWQQQRLMTRVIQDEIFAILVQRSLAVASASAIPQFLREEIARRASLSIAP